MDALIGQQIDHYLIESHIARGGMADVYLAQDVRLRRQVALKVMLADLTHQPEATARFEREAEAVAQLNHPNIVQIYTAGLTPSNQPYLAMQYVKGGSLHAQLTRLAERQQRLDTKDVLNLARQIADALDTAHQAGIVHRDLKPGNILLQPDGTPILTDLGIAAMQGHDTQLTQADKVLGTPQYMSPEQALGRKVDGRSDIYSLGVILYQMLAGRVPFDGDSPLAVLHQHVYEPPEPLSVIRPDLTEATYRAVNKALQKKPADRFQTASEMVRALDQALAAESGEWVRETVAAATPTRVTPRPRLRLWWLLLLLPILVLALCGWGVYGLLRSASPAEDPELPPPPTLPAPGASDSTSTASIGATMTPLVTTNITAVRLDEPLAIDGDLSDWPDVVPVASAYRVYSHESWNGSEDLTALWRLGWDSENLYLGVTIIDDVHVQTRNDNQIFRGDSLDVQIDTDRIGDYGPGLSPDDFQIIFSPGDFDTVPPAVFRFRGNEAGRSAHAPEHNIVFQAGSTETGYVLEAAIPWQDLDVSAASDLVLGIALNASDNDTPGTAEQEVFMSNVPTRTFSDPSSWGTLTLE